MPWAIRVTAQVAQGIAPEERIAECPASGDCSADPPMAELLDLLDVT
jgi:hypothetical protein